MHTGISRLGRYRAAGRIHYGLLEADRWTRLSGPPWSGGVRTGDSDAVAGAPPLTPCEPTKIACIGLNYRAHVAESLTVTRGQEPRSEPLVFLKPPSAALASGEPIRYPAGVTRLDPEAEMALVIGRRVRRAGPEEARAAIAGVTAFNDVSARNYQQQDGQWARAKGFDTFAPFGPWIALGLAPDDLAVECRVNGERRQHGCTRDLLFPSVALVEFVSSFMTLEPGDLIATGTPAGIAPVVPGDRIEVEVEGVGTLVNPVVADA